MKLTLWGVLVFAWCVMFCVGSASGIVEYSDGSFHLIDSLISQPVYVDQDAPNAGTEVELADGGQIMAWLNAYGNSSVTVSGGRIAASLKGYGNSGLMIGGGLIEGPVTVRENSVLYMNGGTVRSIQSFGQTEVAISGGQVTVYVEAWDESVVTISGGGVDSWIGAVSKGMVYIDGTDFIVNGQPAPSGSSLRDYSNFGTLTGTLANGDELDVAYSIGGEDSDICLIPEPTTLLLLGIGAVAVRRRIL